MSFFIGVDPGISGGAAMLDDRKGIVDVVKFRDMTLSDIFSTFHEWSTWPEPNAMSYAMIEKVHSMPRQGVASTFKFGESFGALQMGLTASMIPYDLVTPAKWQGHLNCRTKGDKNVSKAKAQREWPGFKITHANADCLLIALYCLEVKGT